MFVKLEDINSMDEAIHLTGTPVFCDQNFIATATNNNYVGFQVIDVIHGLLGEVSSIQRMPAQDIFVVNHPDGYEILLPDVSDFVKSVDSKKKVILYHAPEGLIEVYKR
jgi:16S rRNA processing protein RimM